MRGWAVMMSVCLYVQDGSVRGAGPGGDDVQPPGPGGVPLQPAVHPAGLRAGAGPRHPGQPVRPHTGLHTGIRGPLL